MTRLSRRKFLAVSGALAAGAAAARLGFAADPAPESADLAAGTTAFGLDLYGKLKDAAGNVFLSPFSVSTALAMTAAGARGKTLEEMAAVLRLPENPHRAYRLMLLSLNTIPEAKGKPAYQLSTANALWAQEGYPWRAEYKKLVAEHYAAGLFDVDFASDPDAVREQINEWVKVQTREKIKDLLGPRVVTLLTRLVLTNAIYFKGDWVDAFKKEATRDRPFFLADGGKVDVPLMHRTGPYHYAEADGYQLLDLPYQGGRVSMTVLLPRKPDGLAAVEKGLTADRLAGDLKRLRPEERVHLYLPRFRVEKGFELTGPLQALGMKAAFDAADFGGMHTGPEKFKISRVVHKAFVDVNEEGTEAAGATGVVLEAASPPPPQPKEFRADRPFLFLIRDSATGSVLFLGRVTNPRG
jgi:serpin B